MAALNPIATATRVMNSGLFFGGMAWLLRGLLYRVRPTKFSGGVDETGRLVAALEATRQLFEGFTLVYLDEHLDPIPR